MAGKVTDEAAREEVEMQMTPMIDVTFLLLIFFMCSIKFKLLDGKLAAYLPKDVGVNTTPIDDQMEKIEIQVVRDKRTKIGFYIVVNSRKFRGANMLTDFYRQVRDLHIKAPDVRATVYPGDEIQYGHIIKVVNECLRAQLTQITFRGTPLEG